MSPVNQQTCAPSLPLPRPLKPSYFWGRAEGTVPWGQALESRVLWSLQLLRGKCY